MLTCVCLAARVFHKASEQLQRNLSFSSVTCGLAVV